MVFKGMSMHIMKFIETLAFLVFPRRCAVCNKVIDIDKQYCISCEPKLRRVPHYVSLLWSHGKTNFHSRCIKPKFSGYIAPFLHQKGGRKMIYCFKFKNRKELAELIAKEMADTFNKYYSDISFDLITAVPMRFTTRIKRGYDQVDVLCGRLSKLIALPYLKLLKQTGKKQPQHTLRQAIKRIENVKGIYTALDKYDIKGKTILLIDDIITTGATLNECAKVLIRKGAKEVYCLSVTING